MVPATDEDVATHPLDLGDVGTTDQQRSKNVAAELFADDDETPATPEAAPEPKAEQPETAEQPSAAETTDVPGLTKDAKGRYHRPDGTVASKDDVEKAKASAPPPEAVVPPVAPPVVDEVAVEPLQWLAYGKPVEIPGAQYKPGHGVFIPDASVPALRQAWARGHERYPAIIKENADLRQSLSETYTRREAEANAVIDVLGQYFSSEQAFGQFLEAAAQSPGLALREIRAMLKEKQLELGQNVREPQDALLNPPVDEGEVAEALTEELEQAFRSPEFAGKFTPSQQRELVNVVFQRAGAYLTKADADYPQWGIRKGETVVNTQSLLADLRYEAGRGVPASKPFAAAGPNKVAATPAAAPPPPPPSAVGRSRVTAAPKQQDDRKKGQVPTRSLSETADWLLSDDD